jgi:hypothetical protein
MILQVKFLTKKTKLNLKKKIALKCKKKKVLAFYNLAQVDRIHKVQINMV